MRFFRRLFSIILLQLLMPIPLPAVEDDHASMKDQSDLMDLEIEELRKIKVATVYGASKYEQKVTEAPSSVSIVTSEDIKQYGYRTLADILRSLQSFNVTYDRNYHYAGVRGFGRPGDYNTHLLVLVDGMRINDSVYDCVLLGTDFVIDVDTIDRVEVVRGPGSSLYGSNAFFGVINVITRQGRHIDGVESSGEASSHETYKGRLSFGHRFPNAADVVLSGSVYDSEGRTLYFREFDQQNPLADPRAANNGITENTDYDKYRKYFLKLAYDDFTLEGAYVSRTKGLAASSFGIDFNDRSNKTLDRRMYWDLKYERAMTEGVEIMGRLYIGEYDYTADLIYGGVKNKDLGMSEWRGVEAKVALSNFAYQKIIAGAEFRDNTRQRQYNYDENPYAVYLDDSRSSSIRAAYIQDVVSISRTINVNAGVRYDDYDSFGGTTNPRLAFIYSPAETQAFKLLYGTAFRAPTEYELRYYLDGVQKPNPELRPETITMYEMAYEQYHRNSRIIATAFSYVIKDLINLTQDPADGLLAYDNISKVETTGFELAQEGSRADGLRGRVSYSMQKSKNAFTGETLSNSPEHMVKGNVAFPLSAPKLSAGIEEQYTGRRKTLQGNYAGSFFLTNVTILYQQFIKNMEFSAGVYNLFDKKYGDPASAEFAQDVIEQDGRTYRVKLTYRF